ncbi:hypothetical protein K7W42_18055 [Deinococcus sp. HMF7604]|uniref:hypothetical protein n=1 Tax=Deinococcus betulae TaxID=2873312 RepID=UPI001CCAA9A2|nr:hypothetical protein [Deinococcus betulae]MBZ9752748.1 hypothetical protein [Deinococcus betulae]
MDADFWPRNLLALAVLLPFIAWLERFPLSRWQRFALQLAVAIVALVLWDLVKLVLP